jgi:hypothetical protein
MSLPIVHFEESNHPLQRCLPAQEKHVVLGVLKALSDETEKFGCAALSICHCIKKAASPHSPSPGFNESFGRKAMSCTIFKPKHISRQVE